MAKFKPHGTRACADAAPINPRILILATQAAKQASLLAVMVQAYAALEKIVTHDQHSSERSATREGLGSLMRALNGEMEREVDALVQSTGATRDFVRNEFGKW